jgi:carboxyl-terminal processing protease
MKRWDWHVLVAAVCVFAVLSGRPARAGTRESDELRRRIDEQQKVIDRQQRELEQQRVALATMKNHGSQDGMEDTWASPAKLPAFRKGAEAFRAVKEALLTNSVETLAVSEDDLYRAAVRGMLQFADPKMQRWNRLLTPQEMAEIKAELHGTIVGIGVRGIDFDAATGYGTVVEPIPGSPAEKAGLLSGDIIVTVDGRLFKDATLEDLVNAIRGEAGVPVTLAILRGSRLMNIPITRDHIQFNAVDSGLLPGGFGFVSIPSFSERTPGELRHALEELGAKQVRGLILDLRQNSGGSFEAAVASAELLVPPGATIVRVKKRSSEETFTSHAQSAPPLLGIPLTVLVDHETSSGAELVAGALRDDRHARVVGMRTYGKWSVQLLDDLPNGYVVKYTTGLFLPPSGTSGEGVGLAPDIEVDQEPGRFCKLPTVAHAEERLASDAQLRTAVTLLETVTRP